MPTPAGYTPHATSPLAQSSFTAEEKEGSDSDAQSSGSGPKAEDSSSYPPQLAAASRGQTAQLQARTQLQERFNNLKNTALIESCEEKIDSIVAFLLEHEDLAYDALDMCERLEDNKKKCMVHVELSEAVEFLPFEDGLGWAFAQTLLDHHGKLPDEQQNPAEILGNLLAHSRTRIDGLRISDHDKNRQPLEWYALLMPVLHQHGNKIFSESESGNDHNLADFMDSLLNKTNAQILEKEVTVANSSLISCVKKGGLQERMKTRISEIIFSDMLPILENLSLSERAVNHQQLLENLSDLIPENKREEFASAILRPYVLLPRQNLTQGDRRDMVKVMLAITKQIPAITAIPSEKATWIHKMRDLLLGEFIHVDDSSLGVILKSNIFKTLIRCRTELVELEDFDTHLSQLKKIASVERDPNVKELTLQWVTAPEQAEVLAQEFERKIAAVLAKEILAEMTAQEFDREAAAVLIEKKLRTLFDAVVVEDILPAIFEEEE